MSARYDIAVFWKQHDSGLYGRRHEMLVEQLARSARVGQVIQFDYPMSAEALRKHESVGRRTEAHQSALIGSSTRSRMRGLRLRENVVAYSFVYEDSAATGEPEDAPAASQYVDYVSAALARHGLDARRVVVWVYPRNFYFPSVRTALKPRLCLADVVDDERNWVQPGSPMHERLTRNYEEVLGQADILITNCAPLGERMATLVTGKAMTVVPNACEEPLEPADRVRPAELRSLRRPIVGYAGNLSSRVDIGLLGHLAAKRPDWQLVLLGSAHLDRTALDLESYPNVHFLGVRPYSEAKHLIRTFDVGVIPHVPSEMTEVMNPLKAFVYCANDVPIVSTPVANIDELREVIDVARTPEEFVAKVARALEHGRGPGAATRRRLAARHSWRARIDQVLDLLDEKTGGEPTTSRPRVGEGAPATRP
jgi:glycosyltransferase involved in cell wall biosynthesis